MNHSGDRNPLLSRHGNKIALLFGCALLFFIGVCAEITCRFLGLGAQHQSMERAFFGLVQQHPSNYLRKDSFGIWGASPGVHHVRCVNPKNNKIIYDVHYSIDPFGRRMTPVNPQSQRNKFAMFMGCSFTYGEGVNDHETLPYYLGEIAKEFKPYNYGFSGLGPFDFLAKLENYDFSSQINFKKGILIYTFIDAHIGRTIGSLSCLLWKKEGVYYKEISKGVFKRQGTFESGRFFTNKFYALLLKSRLFKALGMDIPPRITDGHIALTARVIEAMDKAFKKKYPGSPFYFVIYPGSRYGKKAASFLKESGIHILDFSNLFDKRNPQFHLSSEDPHPSALAYQTLAGAIAEACCHS